MENDENKIRQNKERKNKDFIDRILNTTEEDIAKMNYKEKQQFFKDKNKIVRVIRRGDQGTYIKPKEVNNG